MSLALRLVSLALRGRRCPEVQEQGGMQEDMEPLRMVV